MELRIISDGTREGTRVEDAKTGELVKGVLRVRLSVTGFEVPIAEIVIMNPKVDVHTDFTPVGRDEIMNPKVDVHTDFTPVGRDEESPGAVVDKLPGILNPAIKI